jgi:hypothetical protein
MLEAPDVLTTIEVTLVNAVEVNVNLENDFLAEPNWKPFPY